MADEGAGHSGPLSTLELVWMSAGNSCDVLLELELELEDSRRRFVGDIRVAGRMKPQ
jgi:hypothetical protein